MGDRENQRAAREVEEGRLVAHYLNERQGTDYEARAGDREPADVVLVSPSGRHPPREAQVVTIPLDFRHRDDNQNVQRAQARLTEMLGQQGVNQVYVGLTLSGEAEMHGMPLPRIEQLARLIAGEVGERDATLRYNDIYERSAELAELVHNIVISRPGLVPNTQVDIPLGGALPPDGRWIEEGIRHKLQRYGGEEAVRGITLIIGVAGFVDDDQVTAFQRAFCEADLPFAEIYINTPFDGTICLKAAGQPAPGTPGE
jgi:hypothetical protein